MIWGLLGVYLIGGACWFLITMMEWSIERESMVRYPRLGDEEKVARKARMVLQTPTWPLVLLGMAGRTLSKLQQDVMR